MGLFVCLFSRFVCLTDCLLECLIACVTVCLFVYVCICLFVCLNAGLCVRVFDELLATVLDCSHVCLVVRVLVN